MILLDPLCVDFDTTTDELGNNSDKTCVAITNGAIAKYWDKIRENRVRKAKSKDVNNGEEDKWNDPQYEFEQRKQIADLLQIPTLYPTAAMIWGYSFEIFHCTCGILRNVIMKIYVSTFFDYEWSVNEITNFAKWYGLESIKQQHGDWMKDNEERARNKQVKLSCNGHGYKKMIGSLPKVITKCGNIAFQKLYNLFQQYKRDGQEQTFVAAKLWIEEGILINPNNNNNNDNNNNNNNRNYHSDTSSSNLSNQYNNNLNNNLNNLENNNDNLNDNLNNLDNLHNNEININNSDDSDIDVVANGNNNNSNNHDNNTNSSENESQDSNNDPNLIIDDNVVNLYLPIAKFAIRFVFIEYLSEIMYYMWKSKFDKPIDGSTPPEILKLYDLSKKAGWIALQGDESLVSNI